MSNPDSAAPLYMLYLPHITIHARITCTHPSISSTSDRYTDSKGGAVLRMLRAYLAFSPQHPSQEAGVLDPASGMTQLPMRRRLRQLRSLRQEQSETAAGRRRQLLTQRDPLLGALKAFLERYKYGTVTQQDLWDSLSTSTGGVPPGGTDLMVDAQ